MDMKENLATFALFTVQYTLYSTVPVQYFYGLVVYYIYIFRERKTIF
jgi:hypothetical protein